uniref:L7Ae/L30e/S12e/Gadd45 family ribosomal protein n=1 Tax=Fusobacterium periodonticum TaxID=860 RepID=UPI0028D064E2
NKNYLNILNSMKNSGELVFGINLLFENIEHVHFIVLAQDISKKNEEKILRRISELKIPYVTAGTMEELGKIFNKEEITVIGIKDKKMARGLIED